MFKQQVAEEESEQEEETLGEDEDGMDHDPHHEEDGTNETSPDDILGKHQRLAEEKLQKVFLASSIGALILFVFMN